MLTQIINGQILTPQGWLKDGSVLISDGKILEVTNSDLAVIGAKVVDAKGMYIIPGFVAMNVHGGGGHDFKECTEEAFHSAIAAHMKHGATTIFPTLSSSPKESICKAVSICEKLMAEKDGPVLGLHVEGPYLNAKMAGNLYDVKNPDKEEYMSILESTNCIKRWDASPELPGAHDFRPLSQVERYPGCHYAYGSRIRGYQRSLCGRFYPCGTVLQRNARFPQAS